MNLADRAGAGGPEVSRSDGFRVPLDKNEGVVKRHSSRAVLSAPRDCSDGSLDRESGAVH